MVVRNTELEDFTAWEVEARTEERHEARWSDLSLGESLTLLAVGLGSVVFMALAIVGALAVWKWLT